MLGNIHIICHISINLNLKKLNQKQIDHYSEVITTYGIKLQNFSHKTQKVNSYSEKL